jgi:hypothetical protein
MKRSINRRVLPLFVFWAALRFCPLAVSGACLVVSAFAVWGSLRGFGSYSTTKTAPFMVTGWYWFTASRPFAWRPSGVSLTAAKHEALRAVLAYLRL